MQNRRKFLKNSLVAGVSTAASPLLLQNCKADATQPRANNSQVPTNAFPIVIATWGPNVKATAASMEVLGKGGSALDAVEAGARVPEADPDDTSVGYGGFPDRDGHVTLDACIMNYEGYAGSVSALKNIMHPISVARKVMETTPHVMLVGEGALQFARELGFPEENLLTEKAKQAWQNWLKTKEYKPKINVERHDTIGILAIDAKNQIAGACTTSGMAFKLHGRVGDSPIIGAGMFVDDEVGGAASTGLGEIVLRTLGSFLVVELMRQGRSPQEAVEEVVKRIAKKYPKDAAENQVGFIAIDKKGRHGGYAIQTGFNYVVFQNGENKVYESTSLLPPKKKVE